MEATELVSGTTAAHAWLGGRDYRTMRESLRAVFTLEHEGARWVFATDGHVMVAEKSDAYGVEWPGAYGAKLGPSNVLFREGVGVGAVTRADMAEWAGIPEREDCDRCHGEGSRDHDCDCELCDASTEECRKCAGSGVVTPPRYGWIGAWLFDRNLLASALAPLSVDRLSLSLAESGRAAQLIMDGGDQRVVVMGMQVFDEDQHADAPRLALSGPATATTTPE